MGIHIHVHHHGQHDDEILKLVKEIIYKVNQIIAAGSNDEVIQKAASDLDKSTNELKTAIDKNTPS